MERARTERAKKVAGMSGSVWPAGRAVDVRHGDAEAALRAFYNALGDDGAGVFLLLRIDPDFSAKLAMVAVELGKPRLNLSDPNVVLKLGDLYDKIGEKGKAIEMYWRLVLYFAEEMFYLKAIAMCRNILRIDSDHAGAKELISTLMFGGFPTVVAANLLIATEVRLQQKELHAARTFCGLCEEEVKRESQNVDASLVERLESIKQRLVLEGMVALQQ